MLMIVVIGLFNLLAYRGYPWRTLILLIPLATLAGLLDSPPYLDELRIFASDFFKVLTKAVIVGTVSFSICRFAGQIFQKKAKPSRPETVQPTGSASRRRGGSLLDLAP